MKLLVTFGTFALCIWASVKLVIFIVTSIMKEVPPTEWDGLIKIGLYIICYLLCGGLLLAASGFITTLASSLVKKDF